MSEEHPELEVFETRRFTKSLERLNDVLLQRVEDEIDNIISSPRLGTRKKGDLAHVWVHKFHFQSQEWLLAYSFNEGKLTLHLLQIGSHENFYDDLKRRRKGDLKTMG